jgi:hypothetical protein
MPGFDGIGLDPVKLNVGVTPHIFANGRAHIAGHQGRTKADCDPALLAIAYRARCRLKIVDIGKNAPGNTQERLALFGRYRAARTAFEQLDPEARLQGGYSSAQCRLLDAHCFGGTRKILGIGGGYCKSELTHFDHKALRPLFLFPASPIQPIARPIPRLRFSSSCRGECYNFELMSGPDRRCGCAAYRHESSRPQLSD